MQGVSSVWGHALFCPANIIFWRKLMKKGSKAGYVLQMICGIGMLIFIISRVLLGLWGKGYIPPLQAIILFTGLAILVLIFANWGRRQIEPNVILLVSLVCIFVVLGNVYYNTVGILGGGLIGLIILCSFGIMGLAGNILTIVVLSKQKKAEKAGESAASPAATAPESSAAEQPVAELPPVKALLLRKREGTVIRFENDEGESLELGLVDTVYFKENGPMQLYAVLQKEGEDGVYIAQYDEARDTVFLTDLETAERVLAEWKKEADSPQQNGAVQRAGGRLKLDLYDTIVHKADWKAFRKRASQDELFALAVGSRYQLDGVKPFVKTFLAVVGVILAIVIMVSMEFGQFGIIAGVAVILACNLVVCKQLGYYNTLNDCRWKLDREHLQLLNDLFPDNIFVTILRWLFMILLMIITMPYQAILMLIEILIPAARNWTVAHGGNAGAVISMPKGCDIGGLGTMGAYYASQKFGDVWDQHMQEVEAAKLAKFQKYTYTDQYGMTQEAYSDDGKTFYEGTNKLKEVGTSEDGGKTIKLK